MRTLARRTWFVYLGISGRRCFAEWILEKEIQRGASSAGIEATPHESDLSNGGVFGGRGVDGN